MTFVKHGIIDTVSMTFMRYGIIGTVSMTFMEYGSIGMVSFIDDQISTKYQQLAAVL